MKVKMKTISAGPSGNFGIGSVRNVSPEEAKQLIEGGYAESAEPLEKEAERVGIVSKKTNKKNKAVKDGK